MFVVLTVGTPEGKSWWKKSGDNIKIWDKSPRDNIVDWFWGKKDCDIHLNWPELGDKFQLLKQCFFTTWDLPWTGLSYLIWMGWFDLSQIFASSIRWLAEDKYYEDLPEDDNGVSNFTFKVIKERTSVRCEAQNIYSIDKRTFYVTGRTVPKGNKISTCPLKLFSTKVNKRSCQPE